MPGKTRRFNSGRSRASWRVPSERSSDKRKRLSRRRLRASFELQKQQRKVSPRINADQRGFQNPSENALRRLGRLKYPRDPSTRRKRLAQDDNQKNSNHPSAQGRLQTRRTATKGKLGHGVADSFFCVSSFCVSRMKRSSSRAFFLVSFSSEAKSACDRSSVATWQ